MFAVLVCRLTMGKMNCTKGDPKAGERVMSGEFDSTCGTRLLDTFQHTSARSVLLAQFQVWCLLT